MLCIHCRKAVVVLDQWESPASPMAGNTIIPSKEVSYFLNQSVKTEDSGSLCKNAKQKIGSLKELALNFKFDY